MRYDKALRAFVELAASRHNAVHSSEAAQIINPKRLRRAELDGHVRRLHPQVWALNALPDSNEQTLRAAVLSRKDAAATTTSAAWLHGWIDRPPKRPQLWVPANRSSSHPVADLRRWARIDRAQDVTVVNHIPTLNRAAALCALGPCVDASTLEQCVDEFLRSDSIRWLDATMERIGSRKPGGVHAVRRVLNDPKRASGVPESWFERVVASLVALEWMPAITLQHNVETDNGAYRLDVACPELMLGVEAHSRSFHWRTDEVDADNVRDLALSAAGWHVLYVTWAQTQHPGEFVAAFSAAARTRAELIGLRLPAA